MLAAEWQSILKCLAGWAMG